MNESGKGALMKILLIIAMCLTFATQAIAGIVKELAPIENDLLYNKDLTEKMKIKEDEQYSTSQNPGLSKKQKILIGTGIGAVIIGIIAVAASSSKKDNSSSSNTGTGTGTGTGTSTTTSISVGW